MTRPVQSVLAVLCVLGVVAALAYVTSPGEDRLQTAGVQAHVPVTQATRVCPDPRESGDDHKVTVAAVTPESRVDERAQGEASLAALLPDEDEPLAGIEERGRVRTVDVENGDAPAVTAAATKSMAPGFVAEEHGLVGDGDMRGLAALTCPTPGTDSWFVGGGSEVGHRTTVLVTNREPSPAQVDLTIYGEKGPLDAPGGRGIVVGARQQQEVRLDALAPGAHVTAVHVEARTGRVAAAVHDTEVDGLTPRGTDWVPTAAPPNRRLVLPGIVSGSGSRRLHLLVPGPTDGVVKLEIMTPDRAFVPTGHEVVQVPSGRVTTVDLTKSVGGAPATLLLRSDVPLVAGTESRSGTDTGTSDVAYSAATSPLGGPVAVLGNESGGTLTSTLQLGAPRSDAAVTVTTLTSKGEPTTKKVEVAGRSTKQVDLDGDGVFGAVVTPQEGSGPVHAARVLVRDEGGAPYVTVQPLQSAPTTVAVPEVAADLSTGLYGG